MEEFIITFRESLEAALIVGIIFSYLRKTKNLEFKKYVYGGIILGIIGSILGAVGFHMIVGNFSGLSEQIFEGITMIAGAVLIVYLIVWMSNKKDYSAQLKAQIDTSLNKEKGLGLLFLVFVSILREGVETTLFLNAVISNQNNISQLLAFVGVFIGFLVGYGVYIGLRGMALKNLFNISSILLVLFATGLFAGGVHEFQEVGIIPTFIEHIWDINYIIDENGVFGGFMKALFGYNGNPSLIEVLVYLGVLGTMILLSDLMHYVVP